MSGFAVVIPARFASVRLPGKALRELNGKPLLQHVFERGVESSAEEVVIATDDERIADVAKGFGATVCMTGGQHSSGSERIAEIVDILDWDDQKVVVNLQGDEPSMPAALVDQCAALLSDDRADIATLASPFLSREDFKNPNYVKVIRDDDGHAIYFSRACIPYDRAVEEPTSPQEIALHHHGIYAYRCGILRQLIAAKPSPLELCERLEQLRALSLGMTIAVGVPEQRPGIGVDTAADLERAAHDLRQS